MGAALVATNGQIFTGCNIENASYSVTICAERAVLSAAVSAGVREFEAIALTARHRDYDLDEPVSPCGVCRQALLEFSRMAQSPLLVVMADTHLKRIRELSIDELLPHGFGPELT